jgi:hypothetical protein
MDINITLDILHLFGEASGLCTNVQKSSVYPIRYDDQDLVVLHDLLPCEVAVFPCRYLGLPLAIKKFTRDQIQPIIDKIANKLAGWKADLLTKSGRKIHVQYVLIGMVIYLAMAVDLPAWALKAIDKIRREFLWRGRKDAKDGHCHVAWGIVCRPIELGGLGISSIKELAWSLRMRWLWLAKTEPNRSWTSISIQVPKKVKDFFSMAMQTDLGNGATTFFFGQIGGCWDIELQI